MPPVPAWNIENKAKVNSIGIFLQCMFERVRLGILANIEINADYRPEARGYVIHTYSPCTREVNHIAIVQITDITFRLGDDHHLSHGAPFNNLN